jgi:ABC-type transporter MlaC component
LLPPFITRETRFTDRLANRKQLNFRLRGLLASCLQFFAGMKYISRVCAVSAAVLVMFCLADLSSNTVAAQEKVVEQIVKAEQPVITPAEQETIKRFEQRVKRYVKLRAGVKAKVPKLAKDSTPEQIQAAESAFVEALRVARAGAKPGELFRPDIAQYIRTTLKREVPPAEKKEIRKVVLDKETNIPVPLKVNYPYPDPKEFVEMPATLLLKLPQLPKEVKYRYVGRNLMLVDTDNNLIIDYMLDALP